MKKLAVWWVCVLILACLCACESEESIETASRRQEFLQNQSLTEEQKALLKTKTVILDPGHGFDDPGCQYPQNGIIEKELTLLLARKIGAQLEQSGINILYTHDGEAFENLPALNAFAEAEDYDLRGYLETLVAGYSGREGGEATATVEMFLAGLDEDEVFDIYERSYYANLLGGDLFLSVHINASAINAHAQGFDLFVCEDTPYQERSEGLMEVMEESLRHSFADRRCGTTAYDWDGAFVVTKYPDMPSLLLEAGFASGVEDAKLLTDEQWQDRFAKAVANGVRMYLLGL